MDGDPFDRLARVARPFEAANQVGFLECLRFIDLCDRRPQELVLDFPHWT
jgi:hypothetical protein